MENQDIPSVIKSYCKSFISSPQDREYSWKYCHSAFRRHMAKPSPESRELATLHLVAFLASWGMFRGSGFIYSMNYTAHYNIIDLLTKPEFKPLCNCDFGASPKDVDNIDLIFDAYSKIKEGYGRGRKASDTLGSKILLATLGCIPACDEYFKASFSASQNQSANMSKKFIRKSLEFCSSHAAELRERQALIREQIGYQYSLMKIVDMYFWQLGDELLEKSTSNT